MQVPHLRAAAQEAFRSGCELQAQGRLDDAAARFGAAIALEPRFAEAHINLGNVLVSLQQAQAALACYRRALELRPDLLALRLNIGVCLDRLGAVEEAIASYRDALLGAPGNAQIHHNLGAVLRKAGRLDEAIASYRAGLTLDPAARSTALALIDTLQSAGRFGEATAEIDAARERGGDMVPLDTERANILLALGCSAQALECYRSAAEGAPERLDLQSACLLPMLYVNGIAPSDVEAAHRAFGQRIEARMPAHAERYRNVRDPDRRLRIGYVSSDFRRHSVAYFIEPVIEHHDRRFTEVHCFACTAQADEVTARLRATADAWHDCAALTDDALAARIRAAGIDILIDLSGHTAGNRLLALAHAPAPVQLSWIGYPTWTGLRALAHPVGDPLAYPAFADDAFRAGAPLRLPRVFSCYRPHEDAPPVVQRDVADAAITFGSFNNLAKVSDTCVLLWSRVLKCAPGSRLMLKSHAFADPLGRARIEDRFAAQGITPERLELLGRAESEVAHLVRYHDVDIALDTYPYGGVTTTCEALWMGVPVISLAGAEFRSRMGLTLLSAVGHAELVADDEDGYVDRALALARDAPRRAHLRMTLRERMQASALMDEVGVTRDLEAALRVRWRAWCAGDG